MNVLKRMMVIPLLGVVFSIVGCGTLIERDASSRKNYSSNYYYPAIQYDWAMLTLEGRGGYDYTPVACYLSIACPFIVVLGMPVDFVVDTMLLHSDHKRKLIADREFEGYLLDKYCQADNGLPDKERLEFYDLDVNACPARTVL
ncbi:YceK/YidQ family lipoprotein [Pseudomonas sp. Pseusp3]|uniref:YceK/YidQ family lipoprotein n=1 Tax=Pseudomonas sp. Pseusp3 TaxID=3243029 RepID=UPI0039AFEF52